jgi:hypothetical protein
MREPERIERRRAALIAYDVCRRALTPSGPARRASAGPAPFMERGLPSSYTRCGATRSSSAVAPPIAVSKRESARRSTPTLPVSWCANAAGAAMQPPTLTASTRR